MQAWYPTVSIPARTPIEALEDDPERSDRFVGMYVNDWTRDYGERGRAAVQRLLDRGFDAGLLPQRVIAEFVEVE